VTNRIQRHVYFIMFSAREIFYGYMAISIDEKRAWAIERHLRRFCCDQYKVAHSKPIQLSKSTIQKQMRSDASWIDTMYGYTDGCSGMM